jgi:hypothetical protein
MIDEQDNLIEEEDYSDLGLTDAELESLNGTDDADDVDDDNDVAEDDHLVAESTDKTTDSTDPKETFVPEYKVPAIDKLDEQYQAIESNYNAKNDELAAQYEEGELTFSEFNKLSRELNSQYYSEKSKLDESKLKSSIAQEQATQAAEQKWAWQQEVFFKSNKNFKDDEVLFGALGSALQVLYKNPDNANKDGLQLLNEAAEEVKKRFAPVKQQETSTTPPKDLTKKRRKDDLPVTLSNLPAADFNDNSTGEFDYLDKLSGLAYEKALAKLPEDARERFLMN